MVPVSPCFKDPFLFLVTSVQPSWLLVLGWAGPDPCLADGGGGCCCCGCCVFAAFGFLGTKLGDVVDLFTPPAP